MEGSESAINRVGRAMWTVWGYLTGAVGRYLRPEVTDEEVQNVRFKQADAVPISKGYKELKEKEEEKEKTETKTSERKTREDLQCPSVRVRAAAVRWEKGNIAHDGHEVKGKNKHTRASSEDTDKKSETKKGNEKTFSGSEEADLSVERSETNREQTTKQEEEEEIVKREFVETEEEPIKSEFVDQDLLTKEVDLNVERSENSQEQRWKKEEEDEGVEIMKRAKDETEGEADESSFIEQGVLGKEVDRNVERKVNNQEQGSEQEEKEDCVDTIMTRENDEAEGEPINIDQVLLAKESDLNVEKQGRKQEEEGVEIMQRKNDETGEEPVKSRFTDQDLLLKEPDLNVERNENNQEQKREEEEECDEIMKRENDETDEEEEEEPIKSAFIDQGLLTKESDLNVERNENNQEQKREEEEECDEIMKGENDETEEEEEEEEPIKSECTDQGLLTKESDLNVERNENNQEEEEECDEIMKGENDETEEEEEEEEEEPIKSECIDQGLLTKESDLNVEQSELGEEQRRKQEEEGVDEIVKRENDKTGEQTKCEFLERGILAKEADLNVERNENSQDQRRKSEEEEEEEEGVMNDETEEEPIKSEFIEQGLLANEADLNVERIEKSQEQTRRPGEVQESVDEMSIREYDETEEEEEEEAIKGKFNDPVEQSSLCEMGNQDKNEAEQSIQVTTEHENQASKSQLVDVGLFTLEGRDPLKDGVMQDVEMTENATPSLEKKGIEVENEEKKQETVGKAKDGCHGEFLTWERYTGTDIAEEQEVGDTEMPETLKRVTNKVNDRNVEAERELSETAPIENDETYKKVSGLSTMCEDEDNVTMKLPQLEQSEEQKATSEVDLNVDLGQFEETQDHKGSQQPVVVTKQDVKGVITRPETGTGNQMETVETTSKFRAEVAAVDVKKSAERETSLHEQPIDIEEVALQEIIGQCVLEQESLLEESSDTRVNELSVLKAPFSEIKSVPLEQVDETAVESVDEMPGSSLQELEECSSEAQLQVEAKSSSPEHTAEVFETLSEATGMSDNQLKCEEAQPEWDVSLEENTCDKSILNDTPLQDQTNQDELTVQDSAAEASSRRLQIGLSDTLYVPERESEQETPKMQRDSQNDTEEQERTGEPETGLLAEIKDVTSCLGVVEEISGLTKESETTEWESFREIEAPERKEHKGELESHEETSESNMKVELLNEGMTDTESMVVDSAGGEMELKKKLEEPITEEDEEKCPLVFSESGASKEHEDKVEDGESVVDGKEGREEGGHPALKRGFEKITGDDDVDKPSVLTDLLLPSQASSLDFTVQKSKIAVKNPLVRPPKDPRMLINMASVEPLAPPHPSQPTFLKKSHVEGASVPSKGAIGFKLPGLGAGFPALRKTEAGRKIRDGEDSESVTAQKSDPVSQSADDNVKQETSPHKPKWTPPRQPGMGNPLMMAELKSKLKKPVKE